METFDAPGQSRQRPGGQLRVRAPAAARVVRVAPPVLLATSIGLRVAAVATGRFGLLTARGRKRSRHLRRKDIARLEQPARAYQALADWLAHAHRRGWIDDVDLGERALDPPEVDASGHGVRRDHLAAAVR